MPVATTTKSKSSSEMPSSPDSMTDEMNCEMNDEINAEIILMSNVCVERFYSPGPQFLDHLCFSLAADPQKISTRINKSQVRSTSMDETANDSVPLTLHY